jgi:hypothetical protein
MKWILTVSLALGTVPSLAGQIVPPIALGMRIKVRTATTDGTRSPPIDGILERLSRDSVILRPHGGGELQAVSTNQDTRYFIHTGRKSSLIRGTIIGTLVGVITGGSVYAIAGGRSCPEGRTECSLQERHVVKGTSIFILVGAITGFTIGAFSAHDIWRESERESRVALVAGPAGFGVTIRF